MVMPTFIQTPAINNQAPDNRQTYAMPGAGPFQLRHQTPPPPVAPIPATAAMRMPLAPPNLSPIVLMLPRTKGGGGI